MRKFLFLTLTLFGGLLGFAYAYFIGCKTGTCPLTSDPISSTIYGGIIGSLVALAFPINVKSNDKRTEGEVNGNS